MSKPLAGVTAGVNPTFGLLPEAATNARMPEKTESRQKLVIQTSLGTFAADGHCVLAVDDVKITVSVPYPAKCHYYALGERECQHIGPRRSRKATTVGCETFKGLGKR